MAGCELHWPREIPQPPTQNEVRPFENKTESTLKRANKIRNGELFARGRPALCPIKTVSYSNRGRKIKQSSSNLLRPKTVQVRTSSISISGLGDDGQDRDPGPRCTQREGFTADQTNAKKYAQVWSTFIQSDDRIYKVLPAACR